MNKIASLIVSVQMIGHLNERSIGFFDNSKPMVAQFVQLAKLVQIAQLT